MKVRTGPILTIDQIIDAGTADIDTALAQDRPDLIRDIVTRIARQASRSGAQVSADELLGAQEAAEELGITRGYVTRLARRDHLGMTVGTVWLFRPEDIEAMRTTIANAVVGRRKSHYRLSGGPARPRPAEPAATS